MKLFNLKIIKLLITCWFAFNVNASILSSTSVCPLIPLPQQYVRLNSVFTLSSNTTLIYDKEFKAQAILLQQELLKVKGISVTLCVFDKNINVKGKVIQISRAKSVTDNRDSYNINMTSDRVLIESGTPEGIVNALYSFVQLAMLSTTKDNQVLIDCWKITDYSRYQWRGLMLDESRHFFGKEKVKQILSWMALYKMNRFHWHLTDTPGWRIEIKKYPLLANVGGVGCYSSQNETYWDPNVSTQYYLQEDIKEIVRYASERNIEIIPEIDMPGHASAALRAYPEFSGGGTKPRYPNYTFNPGKDTVYTFLTNILKEVDVLFPSEIIHLGGDEVHYGNEDWKTDNSIQLLMKSKNMTDLKEVENYFFKRISDSLFNFNNKLAAWDEVADSDLAPEKTIVFFWRQNRLEQLQKSLDKNFSIVLCPRLPMYLDYAQDSLQIHGVPWKKFGVNSYEKIYNFEKSDFDVKYPKNAKILGIQANVWTERIKTEQRLDYMLFPRIAALAETSWTEEKNKNQENFKERLKRQFQLYSEDGIYYNNPFEPKLTGEPVK